MYIIAYQTCMSLSRKMNLSKQKIAIIKKSAKVGYSAPILSEGSGDSDGYRVIYGDLSIATSPPEPRLGEGE